MQQNTHLTNRTATATTRRIEQIAGYGAGLYGLGVAIAVLTALGEPAVVAIVPVLPLIIAAEATYLHVRYQRRAALIALWLTAALQLAITILAILSIGIFLLAGLVLILIAAIAAHLADRQHTVSATANNLRPARASSVEHRVPSGRFSPVTRMNRAP